MFEIELVNPKSETPYNVALTIITPPPPFMLEYYFAKKKQAMSSLFDQISEKNHEELKKLKQKQHEESKTIEI